MSAIRPQVNDIEARQPTTPVTAEEFDEIFERLKAWGVWEVEDRGAFNRLNPALTLRGAELIRTGVSVPMALPWNTAYEVDNHRPALHHMVDLGDREAPEPSTNKDFIAVDYHGKSVSHLDALSHIAYKGQLFGGVTSRTAVDATGAHFGAVSALGHYAGRGVLLDIPASRGTDWLAPGEAVYPEDILEAEKRLGVTIGEGDTVLLRTGHKKRRNSHGPWDSAALSAGLHVSSMPLLAERGITLLGSDGDSDVRPSPTPGIHSPIHILAITALGIPLLDNLDLELVAETASAEQRYEFFAVVAPLNIPSGTGSPVNPIAIF